MPGGCTDQYRNTTERMQPDTARRLHQALSTERLAGYRRRIDHDGDTALFAHYVWNMALSEALYPALQGVEVVLRNAIHEAARRHFGRDDWFDDTAVIHHRNDIVNLKKAKEMLQRQNKPLEPSRIIAELSFGFWTSLLDRRYERVLWPRLIRAAFPHVPRRLRTRRELSRRFHRIRLLRNRVFHHEPIWHWRDLAQQHIEILEAIARIEPDVRELVVSIDRLADVYRNGLRTITVQME